MEYDDTPMGEEDAKDRDDIEDSYIDVTSLITSSSHSASRLHDAKVVVGRKGSGKTHILLHIQQLARNDGREVVYSHLDHDLFQGWGLATYRGDQRAEDSVLLWTHVWRVALSIAAMSRFTARRISPRAQHAIRASADTLLFDTAGPDPHKALILEMTERYGVELIPDVTMPINPIEAVERLTRRFKNLRSINAFFSDNVNFRGIEADLAVLLHQYGTVQFLIDGLDEYAWADPKGWLDLQVGLFAATFELSTVRTYTQYLKLTVSLRNYVFTRAAQSPHIDRAKPHILKLNWDYPSAEKFLNRRLLKLRGGNFARSEHLSGSRPLAEWLGFNSVRSPRRGEAEDVERYVLRHSRLSPRNLVETFNGLCAIQNQRALEGRSLSPEDFRDQIEAQARSVGSLMLKVAAEEVLALSPFLSGRRDTAHMPEYAITDIAGKIAVGVSECGSEIIDREAGTAFIRKLAERAGFDMSAGEEGVLRDLEAGLWRSGILAYQRDGDGSTTWLFSWAASDMGPAGYAQTARRIGFHPCLIGLCSLEISEDGPVI